MKNEEKKGLKLTGLLYNALIIGCVVIALTSGFKIV